MFTKTDNGVCIEMSEDDFSLLLLTIGFAAGAQHQRNDKRSFNRSLKLANTINEGNPNWKPYEIEAEVTNGNVR